MKKSILFLCWVLLSAPLLAQTAEEIISKHLEARGGIDKIKSIQTLIYEGTMQQQGVDIEMKFTYAHNKGSKVEFTAMGQTGYSIITTTEGWSFNPFAGNASAEALPESAVKDAQGQLDIHGPFVDYKEKGNTIAYLGKESLQGVEYFKIKVTGKTGKSMTYYFNKDYLITKVVGTATIAGVEQEVSTEFSDYRKTPEGIVLAFHRINQNSDVTFQKATINPVLPDTVFKPEN